MMKKYITIMIVLAATAFTVSANATDKKGLKGFSGGMMVHSGYLGSLTLS